MENRIRVFISYSHTDLEMVSKLVKVPEDWGIEFIWDKKLVAGFGFHNQLKNLISSAHIFMPIITKESSRRGWVHQEIGYAMALSIPVLPVTTEDQDPTGMLQTLHAVKISEKADSLEPYMNRLTFTRLLSNVETKPIFHCAHLPEERTRMITEYCNEVSGMDKSGLVRQKGGLTSFHIPDEHVSSNAWIERYIGHPVSEYHMKNQRKERQALAQHAANAGCRLIINPNHTKIKHAPEASRARIKELIKFLSNAQIQVAIAVENSPNIDESLTILGNWFVAESVSFKDGDGFTNTFFTRDAAEIQRRIEDFDFLFESLLEATGWTEDNSREEAIKYLQTLVEELKQ